MTIEHIAMYVFDIEKAKQFFVRYFNAVSNNGYHNASTGFRSYFLTFDGEARLEIMNKPNLSSDDEKGNHFGYAHIAFGVGSEENVRQLTENLRADGYKVVSGPRTTEDGYYESCICDFEGNLIEITV